MRVQSVARASYRAARFVHQELTPRLYTRGAWGRRSRAPAKAAWAAIPTACLVHCRAVANGCVSGNPYCMFGSASALNLVVWAENSGFGPLGKRNRSG